MYTVQPAPDPSVPEQLLAAIENSLALVPTMLKLFSVIDVVPKLYKLIPWLPLVVLPRFSASRFWRSAREHGATLTYVLGAMPGLMFGQPASPLDRDHVMRLVLCSGIVPDLHRQFEERWGAPWREIYGST